MVRNSGSAPAPRQTRQPSRAVTLHKSERSPTSRADRPSSAGKANDHASLSRPSTSRSAGDAPIAETSDEQDDWNNNEGEFNPICTYSYTPHPSFPHNIIELPIDVETYFVDKNIINGPLPGTIHICARCRRTLMTDASGDNRMWALPCGPINDGRCIDQLSGVTPTPVIDNPSPSNVKGKGKARERDEPPAKRAKACKNPKRFECPVEGCTQKCHKVAGTRNSARVIYD
ncbi:uncharacterized protein SPSC_03830 [Sporisorium scitamineum]|uniref:Uncharacterized protein n=1 Tax=Sporisorium scitamineum TaxID=49012 RepID=A0A127Z2W8_9BASI|nr:uncharacterized protein SPSC_03830 [Sporisorium scitamineum]